MVTEKEKMLAGELYDASDAQLSAERLKARSLCQALNAMPAGDGPRRTAVQDELFGRPVGASITPPFHCDYGYNITLGHNAYFNCNCVILDVCSVTIGARSLFGPAMQIYAVGKPETLAPALAPRSAMMSR